MRDETYSQCQVLRQERARHVARLPIEAQFDAISQERRVLLHFIYNDFHYEESCSLTFIFCKDNFFCARPSIDARDAESRTGRSSVSESSRES
jgi:hypothetical protein